MSRGLGEWFRAQIKYVELTTSVIHDVKGRDWKLVILKYTQISTLTNGD